MIRILIAHAAPGVVPLYEAALAAAGIEGTVDAFVSRHAGLSEAYRAEALELRRDGIILPGLLERHLGPVAADDVIVLVTYSAAYALAREVLRGGERVHLVLVDSLHAGLDPDGTASDADLAPFVEQARRAQRSELLFWDGHSDVATAGYASTTQTADELVRLAGHELGLWHVEAFDVARDAAEEHRKALTGWGPAFVADAVRALLDAQAESPALVSTIAAIEPVSNHGPVPRVATPLSPLQLAIALRDAHLDVFGVLPSPVRLAIAWAQCAHEHARGAAIYGSNIGNITTGSAWAGAYYTVRVKERVRRNPDVWAWKNLRFRVHETARAGAADYWRMLGRRYAAVLPLFDQGDAQGAAELLSRLGYYTDLVSRYAPAMVSLTKTAIATILPALPAVGEPPSAAAVAIFDRLVQLTEGARAGLDGLGSFDAAFGRVA